VPFRVGTILAAFFVVVKMAGGLTKQREAFVFYYLGGKPGPDGFRPFHGTKSAIEAGYSEKSAPSIASQLLKDTKVSARIQDELNQRAMPAEAVLAELTDIAVSGWRDHLQLQYNDKGDVVGAKMDLRAKVDALELLGKHHQLFSENLNINGGIELRTIVGIPEDTP
jgi:phage terminase small subunit